MSTPTATSDRPLPRKRLLGERLLEAGLVQEAQLERALQAQKTTGEQLGRLLMRLGYVGETDLLRLLCEDADVPFSALENTEAQADAIALVPEPLARTGMILPLRIDGDGRLAVALADPFDMTTLASLERVTGRRVAVVGAPRERIAELLERSYGGRAAPPPAPAPVPDARVRAERPAPPADAPPEVHGTAARVVDEILQSAVSRGATDVHVEPTDSGVVVRFRVDGILRKGPAFPKDMQGSLLTRLKIMAGMNIAETRLPQDGRIRIRASGRDVDLRISTFPTLHGEDLVLRVLDRGRVPLRLGGLGLQPADLELFRETLRRPNGLVLLTGPTGSGKTTTLYSALAEMNTLERCVLTLEDPIEYELEGIRQAQVNPRAGLTFATGLRSMLRHDPDVILVGEMRDHETAEIGLRAAMTGHMVLSTLHTNSAAGAIPRLLDMGLEPFALASSLQLCIAQRLVRVLCPGCRQTSDIPPAVRRRFDLEGVTLFRATGCAACNATGYRGRVAIYELLPIDERVAACIYERGDAEDLQRSSGRPNLLAAGLVRVRDGTTSLEELLRVVSL